jgi:hypothetical protein
LEVLIARILLPFGIEFASLLFIGHPLAASSSELLYNLHWLPVHHRVNFKIALFTYKILTFNQPSYLASLVNLNIAPRTLHSSDQHLLYLPRTCTVTGGRAFNLAAPSMEFFTNLHSLLFFYRLVQTASQNFLLLFSFSLTSSSHAGLPVPLIQGLGPDFCARKQFYVSYRIVFGNSVHTHSFPASECKKT